MFDVVVLAGGKGTRMRSSEPKVLAELKGKPLIDYVRQNITEFDMDLVPTIVVGYEAGKVMEHLGPKCSYVMQEEQLGTGHAVACCKSLLESRGSHVVVVYGDMPLVGAEVLRGLTQRHVETNAALTLGTIQVPDYKDWREGFGNFGRIIRDENGRLQSIVEVKNASPEQLKILEVNPGIYCFNGTWLWQNIDLLSSENLQGEYLLTDMLEIAVRQQMLVETVLIDPVSGLGINSPEQLNIVDAVIDQLEM